jgi:HK97 family phage portal protein
VANIERIPVVRSQTPPRIEGNQNRETPFKSHSTYTRMYKQHPIVRAVVDKISRTAVATGYQLVPVDSTAEVNDANAKKIDLTFRRSKIVSLLRQTYQDLLIYGDAFWYILPARDGVPFRFYRIAPQQVNLVIDTETREVTSYITRDPKNGREVQYDPDEFLHFKIADPDNDFYGLSPLESLGSTVAQDLFAQTYNESFFANSAQTGIVFNMKNASKEEVERNREFLKKEYTSAANAHKPLLLEGDVEVSKSVSSPAEMQFIEGRRQLTMEILAVFDLPYTKLGGTSESANRSQSAENDKTYRTETIQPLQAIVEEVINENLIINTFGIDDILFEHREIDTRDEATQMKLYIDAMTHGIYDLNYIRKAVGVAPTEGGDTAFFQTSTGLVPVAEALAPAQPAPQVTDQPINQPGEPLDPVDTSNPTAPRGGTDGEPA